MNLYDYVANSPVNLNDSWGLRWGVGALLDWFNNWLNKQPTVDYSNNPYYQEAERDADLLDYWEQQTESTCKKGTMMSPWSVASGNLALNQVIGQFRMLSSSCCLVAVKWTG